jgi:hypothetical protein
VKYLNILSVNWIAQKARGRYFGNKQLNVPETPVDPRDWVLVGAPAKEDLTKMSEFSRRGLTPSVKNQGSIGSCVGHSGRVVYGSEEEFKDKEPSPMWIYKKGQTYDPWPGEDYSGTTIKGACKAIGKEGCCEEEFWPDEGREDAPVLPGAEENALTHKISGYYVVAAPKTVEVKTALLKSPLWTAIKVRRHFFYTDRTGIVDSEKYLASDEAGGHAIAMIGWKEIDGKLYWEFQNSWGPWFGNKGFFFMEDALFRKVIMNSIGPYYLSVKPKPDPRPDPRPKKKKFDKKYLIIAAGAAMAIWTVLKIM